MKKILLLLLIMFMIFINVPTYAFNIKNIDLKVEDGDISIVFLRLKNSSSILITDNDNSNLFVLDYKNDKGLKDSLKIFNSHPNIYYLNKNLDKKVDDIYVVKNNDFFKFRINNYSLCVYKDNVTNNSCDFIYLMHLNKEFKLDENVSAIFYDDSINKKLLTQVQESWVDNNIVSTDSFTILKLREENYNIVVVPSTKVNN